MPGVASVIGASSCTGVSSAAGASVVAGGSPGKRNPLRSRGARPGGRGTAMRGMRVPFRGAKCALAQGAQNSEPIEPAKQIFEAATRDRCLQSHGKYFDRSADNATCRHALALSQLLDLASDHVRRTRGPHIAIVTIDDRLEGLAIARLGGGTAGSHLIGRDRRVEVPRVENGGVNTKSCNFQPQRLNEAIE